MMFHKPHSLFFTLALLLGVASACGQGQLSLINGCQRISYIQGCLQYSPTTTTQCAACEFNYDLVNGRCDYNPQPVEKCCVAFGSNGECSKCQTGLFLDNGACKQANLIGCLSKTGASCNNCADGFFLNNGRCAEGVKRCNYYNKNGSCSTCAAGYSLSAGLCSPSLISNCLTQENGKCSKCMSPFTLSNGECQIANCARSSEYGCVECAPYFFATEAGVCSPFEAGCRTYRHGSCVDCLPNFIFSNGVCNMVGCSGQSNGVCKTCSTGYVLNGDGVCRIPNCLQSIQDRCLICDAGYHLTSGKCQPIAANCVNYVGEVCRSCAAGYFLGSDGRCAPQQPGCTKYAQGVCVECSSPFLISTGGKCLIDGCDKVDASGCLTCRAPYLLSGRVCRLPNCEKASNGLCSLCSKNYHLYNKQCIVDDANCQGYDSSGRCTGCVANFHLSDINTCVINLPGCIYSGSTCSSCSAPFSFTSGACSIPNCKTYNSQGCSVCHSKYYLSSSGTCLAEEIGGIYVGGVMTGCSALFVFNSATKKCQIEGCTKYAAEGCVSCLSPYKLNKNTCRIDNCVRSEKGQCVQCEGGFKVQNGLCLRSIDNCLEYNAIGCQTCANLFYLSALSDSCLPVEPGCIYSNGKCVKCADPFSFNNGACVIEGCSVFDVLGCKTCKSNFYLDSGKCLLPNCKTLLNGACSTCDDGFELSTGICKATDKCLELTPNGTCKTCSKGFSPNICGRCVPSVGNCAYYGRNGKCEECVNMYFLTKDFTCQIRDKGCKSYVAGVCTECVANFFLYDGICFPFTEGCLKYEGKDCVSCSTGYSLSKGICLKSSSKLTKGLVFDDWVTTNITNVTNQSDGKDIDFDTVAAKNPASGAKIGTLFYSSVFSSTYNSYGINSTYGWKAGKSVVGEWAGIQLSSAQTFYEFQIQAGENGAFVSQFEIEFSVDGVEFKKVPGIFTASCEGSKIVTVSFTPVYAIAIRFVVAKFSGWPSARFDFIYNNIDEKTDWSGLFSTNQINKKIYAISSSRLSNQLDINIRRFFNPVRDCSDKEKCWSGIELCEPKNVTAINFPTTTNTTGAITEFYIDYSLDGNYFSCYENCATIPVSTSKFTFKNALKAKNVRVHPTKWSGSPQVQFTFDYN